MINVMDLSPHEPDQEPIRPEHYEVLDSQGNELRPGPPRQATTFPFVSIAILVVCGLVFIVANLLFPMLTGSDALLLSLTFSPGHGLLFPGVISHMFAHGGFWHLVFNMLMLYFLGMIIEQRYGPWKYLVLYFGAGIFAGLAQAVINPLGLLLGASGALAGVLAAFIRHYPHARLLIWGILPVPAWLVGVLWIGYNVVGMQGEGTGVAFMAHIAGFLAGMVISVLMYPPRDRRAGSQ